MLVLYAPAMGGLLRSAFGWQNYWLQFVPAFAGTAWCLWWLSKQASDDFSWSRSLPLLLAVSVCTSPYGWLFDQVVLLPALIERVAGINKSGNKIAVIWIAVYFAANAGIAVLLAFGYGMLSQAYVWTAPLWLFLYMATAHREDNHYHHPIADDAGRGETRNFASVQRLDFRRIISRSPRRLVS